MTTSEVVLEMMQAIETYYPSGGVGWRSKVQPRTILQIEHKDWIIGFDAVGGRPEIQPISYPSAASDPLIDGRTVGDWVGLLRHATGNRLTNFVQMNITKNQGYNESMIVTVGDRTFVAPIQTLHGSTTTPGLEYVDMFFERAMPSQTRDHTPINGPTSCTCSSFDLFNYGCKCGAFKLDKTKTK